MKTAYLSEYTGYRHNRYDGFNCSWGILMAMGGNGTADCFVTHDCGNDENSEELCDCDGLESMSAVFEDGELPEDFYEIVINNLEADDVETIKSLCNNETYTVTQNFGSGHVTLLFYAKNNQLFCDVENQTFLITNVTPKDADIEETETMELKLSQHAGKESFIDAILAEWPKTEFNPENVNLKKIKSDKDGAILWHVTGPDFNDAFFLLETQYSQPMISDDSDSLWI